MLTARSLFFAAGCGLLLAGSCWAQSPATPPYGAMRWRAIGPMRAGRTHALAGVPTQPDVFYIGAADGGVWKTTDAGETWHPVFDAEPTGSIGAIAVAPSDPDIVYVGSGEDLPRPDLSVGDGVYKSTDAGATWTHLGLRDGQQITKIIVDPGNPERLFVAVLGHPYGPNAERGLYRSVDGGQNFQQVLYKDENTGAQEVVFDPHNPQTLYAALWETRQGPWENGVWNGDEGGMFKSTDGGDHWEQLHGGLPGGAVKINSIAVAPSDSNRIYAPASGTDETGRPVSGMYRSDDAGRSWARVNTDPRITGAEQYVGVDPDDPDTLYDATRVAFKSTDGGKTWIGWRGSPGGDDYQDIWINPGNGRIILLTSDQGAIVTVNGGESWSQWYNQNTGQMYHVTADNAYPYRLCSGQQDSGSACVSSRGDDGSITFHDWHPVGIEEYGYAAPDPLNPDIVYGGKVTRYDRRTGQVADVGPAHGADYRVLRTAPLLFSPVDPHILYFGSNTLWKTANGGQSWQQISPDLTRKTWTVPTNVGIFLGQPGAAPSQRGVIYTIAPSPLDINRIWIGTDDGLIQLTTDGGQHWSDVTPSQLAPWDKVSIMDASHFDPQTAYAAINTMHLDDMRPHLYRTRDGGKSWTEIDNGIPAGAATDVIREDPHRRGLLFAGTETQVYFSIDDGDHWQSLRLNAPATSFRDLQVKDDDLVAGTHGRGFLILDDITPLRQLSATTGDTPVVLFRPERATRVRWDMNPPTPWPMDMATGENPPDGAIVDYYLQSPAQGAVRLDILDATGRVVRHYSSTDAPPPPEAYPTWPKMWDRPPQIFSAEAGPHRFLWDLHFDPAPGIATALAEDEAVPHNTPRSYSSPWVMPGTYTVRLTVDGHTYTQPLTVRMDPRVKAPAADLARQFSLSMEMYNGVAAASRALDQATALRQQQPALVSQINAIAGAAGGGRGGRGGGGRGRGGAGASPTLSSIRTTLNGVESQMQAADYAPTEQQAAAAAQAQAELQSLLSRWKQFVAAHP